ncbi:protein ecdysoneless homolog [Oculina patagonica]
MENAVKYRIFVKDANSFVTESNLEVLIANYLAFLSPLIDDFIWQNESFCLVTKNSKGDVPAHLYGKTKFGDNVDDEWFIVSLLFKLSKAFPETCISITDNDGEFLLIEAAHFLPRWLNPDNSKNRVFVHGGKVHIIPIPSTPGEVTIYPTGTPLLDQALQLVFGPHNTEAAAKIQKTIRQRMEQLSEQSQNAFHHAHCYVPAEVKYVLDQKPSLISPIVQAFYERDPIDMKACRTMEQFTLKTRLMSRIRFTRCLYAQLTQQPFKPDRRSEWTLPLVSNPQYKAHELGLKLACGFQILCRRSGAKEADLKVEGDPKGPKWDKFLACLTEQGYFKGEVEGSKLHQDLLKKAKHQFSENFAGESRQSERRLHAQRYLSQVHGDDNFTQQK